MFRTDAEGNDSGLYTEGNPATGVPATVVSADAMNAIQEELCNIIETAGFTLNKLNDEQLTAAINAIVQNGGTTPVESDILNNQSTAQDITGMSFSGSSTKHVELTIDAYRKTDSEEKSAVIKVYMIYKPGAAAWSVSWDSQGDSMGLTFHVSGNQLQYKSDDLAGSNYEGTMLISIRKMKNV